MSLVGPAIKQQYQELRQAASVLQAIGKKSVNDFTSREIDQTEKFARKLWGSLGIKSPYLRAWFGEWRLNDTTPVMVANKMGAQRGQTKMLIPDGISTYPERSLVRQQVRHQGKSGMQENTFLISTTSLKTLFFWIAGPAHINPRTLS